jgi:hypothetical protein
MPGFFSMRIAPGVRISTSSRGLRTHLGPRAARLHVGGGRTGVSTGTGPFTYYQGLTGRRNGHALGRSPVRSTADKEQLAKAISAQLTEISELHRQTFTPVSKAVASRPRLPPFGKLLALSEHHELRGVGLRDREARRRARLRGRELAEDHARELLAAADHDVAQQQAVIDAQWQQLVDNDEDTVLEVLSAAFSDNQAPVAAVGVEGSEVSLVVQVPGPGVLPDRVPSQTAAGNLSLTKMQKSDAARWHATLVCGHVVITAKEAFAVCPGLSSARVVAVTAPGRFTSSVVPIMATRLARHSLDSVPWATASAADIIDQLGTDTLLNVKGRSRELGPLELKSEPALRELLDRFDRT